MTQEHNLTLLVGQLPQGLLETLTLFDKHDRTLRRFHAGISVARLGDTCRIFPGLSQINRSCLIGHSLEQVTA
jgi:hypothetical protein